MLRGLLLDDDAEGGAVMGFGGFDEETTGMILLDDALGEGETESPTAFLGGEPRGEYLLGCGLGHSATGVGDVEDDGCGTVGEDEGQGAFTLHGVDGILT